MIERLNRTYKASYRPTNGFDNYDGANYDLALWVAYYNFLRPHKHANHQVLNKIDTLCNADNMPGKWQLLIYLGQQTIHPSLFSLLNFFIGHLTLSIMFTDLDSQLL